LSGPAPAPIAWAYDFSFERPLESLLEAFNAAGPWTWQGRESHWYGSYLNSRLVAGLRLRVHNFPDQPQPFSALIEIAPGSGATRAAIDAALRALLAAAGARDLREIEPYD
jgi:hypothetical protein